MIELGPVTVTVDSPSTRILTWSQAVERRGAREETTPLMLSIDVTDEVLQGPPTPESSVDNRLIRLAYHGWRAELSPSERRAHATLSLAGDAERRGPRRLQSLLRVLAQTMLLPRGLGLHAAGLTKNGQGYAFIGPRGAGKTTLARAVPPASRLGDDYVIAAQNDAGHWRLHPTPFSGREGLAAEASAAPLRAIAVLRQATETRAIRLSPSEAAARLVPSVVHAGQDRASQEAALACIDALVHAVPVVELALTLGGPAIDAVEAAL